MNTPTPEQIDQLIIDSQMRDRRTPAAIAAGNTEGLHPEVVKAFSDPDALASYELTLARKSAQTSILHRLQPYVDPSTDQELRTPLDLVTELYKRVRLESDIRSVEESSSWDYCKQAAIDWLKKQRRWIPIHEDAHWYQIGCVPPHFQYGDRMMCGEAYSGPYHLTTYRRYGSKYYCCLLTRREVVDESFLAKLPFADDLPLMGVPKEEGVEA